MFSIFKCFQVQKEEEKEIKEEKPIYNHGKDGDNKYNKEQLFILIKDKINYDFIDYKNNKSTGVLNTRIDDFRWWLKQQLKDMAIPVQFQQTHYIYYESQLKEIVYCRLHNDNVDLLLTLFNNDEEEEEQSYERVETGIIEEIDEEI